MINTPDELQAALAQRLQLDQDIADYYARLPRLRGSGYATPPDEYEAMQEAHHNAEELTRQTGIRHVMESTGDGRWRVIRREDTADE